LKHGSKRANLSAMLSQIMLNALEPDKRVVAAATRVQAMAGLSKHYLAQIF
jgi:hypothetical protein